MNRTLVRFLLIIGSMLFTFGCRSTKYVPEGEQLLNRVHIRSTSSSDISKTELKSYLRQDANHRILGVWRFYLGLYNLSGRDDSKGINRWLKSIGEPPVVFDSTLMQRSVEQMELYMHNRGYFLTAVVDTTKAISSKKTEITYTIHPGPRYRINNVYYKIEDSHVAPFFYSDTARMLLRKDRGFVSELHNRERDRITKNLNNSGFYNFSKEYIYYIADSTIGNYRINDTLVLVRPPENVPGRDKNGNHARYVMGDVYFQVGDDIQMNDDAVAPLDTLHYAGFYILYRDKLDFKPDVLINSNYINPGELYQIDLVDKTQSLLSGLRLFKYINIKFNERPGVVEKNGHHILDCTIHVVPSSYQSIAFALEGTNSSGNLGAAGNIKYQHKNIFKGAELLTLNARLARQNQFVSRGGVIGEKFNTLEVGGEGSVVFPSFIIPFRIEKFRQKYNPKTTIAIAYNYQKRPDYTRTIASTRFGYTWRSGRYSSHSLFPFDFNLVNIPYVDPRFKEDIEKIFLKHTYEDHLIMNLNYTYLFNQQEIGRRLRSFWYFRYVFESGGNAIDLLNPLWQNSDKQEYGTLFGIRYAQYLKSDIDLRFHNPLSRRTSITYRLFAGAGIPYGNLDVLPFEKRYFSGGANSVRAWPVRGLGPGESSERPSVFYNQTADIKLEMNVEYRFRLFWLLEGALFVDAGNIWDIKSNSNVEGGLFEWNKFYKQFAIGAGFGTRLDFNYFIFRIDTGFKLHDPAFPTGSRWIPITRRYTWDDVAFNFAIGYPF